jgi:hypothetical protein
MTLPRFDAIVAHWEAVPPLSVSVAAIASVMGVGRPAQKRDKPKAAVGNDGKMLELVEMLGASGFANEKPPWLMT